MLIYVRNKTDEDNIVVNIEIIMKHPEPFSSMFENLM